MGQRTLDKESRQHSQTKVNPTQSHGVGLWQGRRKVVGIRVDEKLYEAFKPVAKAVFGSVCRPVEAFMASVIAIAETGVNFGKTIDVGKIVIERNLRPRRKLEVEGPRSCGHADCDEVAVGVGVWHGPVIEKKLLLCEKHFAEARRNPKNWKELCVHPSASKEKGGV